MDAAVPRRWSTAQRPFRHEGDARHRPGWLARAASSPGEEDGLLRRWQALLAHVANTANESGIFDPWAAGWLLWSGLGAEPSRRLADRLLDAGALRRAGGRVYVAGWRETYRLPDPPRG